MRILGLDPGLRCTGWGLLSWNDGGVTPQAWGHIKPPVSAPLATRLSFLFHELSQCLREHNPEKIALEMTLVGGGKKDSLKLAFARGACLAALGTAQCPVYEYEPTHIKKMLVGYGKASKEQMVFMIQQRLSIKSALLADEADALALALTHIYTVEYL